MKVKQIALCMLASSLGFAQTNALEDCRPTTVAESQSRTDLKHRSATSGAAAQQVTVPDILQWDAPAKIGLKATRTSEQPIDDLENQVFTVGGVLWRIVLEGNDCDLHIELSDLGKGKLANRVIIEVPQEDKSARDAVMALLPPNSRTRILNSKPNSKGNYKALTLATGVRIKVTGFGFYDAYHYSPNWQASTGGHCSCAPNQVRKRGNNHGSCAVGTL